MKTTTVIDRLLGIKYISKERFDIVLNDIRTEVDRAFCTVAASADFDSDGCISVRETIAVIKRLFSSSVRTLKLMLRAGETND